MAAVTMPSEIGLFHLGREILFQIAIAPKIFILTSALSDWMNSMRIGCWVKWPNSFGPISRVGHKRLLFRGYISFWYWRLLAEQRLKRLALQ